MQKNVPTFRRVNWAETRQSVSKVNAELATIIDELDPGPEFGLFEATYPYGVEILRQGRFYVPDHTGNMISFDDSQFPADLKDEFSYNGGSNPAAVVLGGSMEFYLPRESHTIPFSNGYFLAGKVFGTWRVLNSTKICHPTFLWHLSSGSRSVFMLPKISSALGYSRLKKYFHISFDSPTQFSDHWQIFRTLAVHSDFKDNWSCKILYFGKKWFDFLNDKAWNSFNLFFYQTSWKYSEYWRNQGIWNLIFSMFQEEKNLKPNPYVADTVKHLIGMGSGMLPGFTPASDNSAGPIRHLQEIFRDIYQLENYAPIILHPHFLSETNDYRPTYYSLNYPTTMAFSPRSRRLANKISDLSEIKYLLDKYLNYLATEKLNVQDSLLGNISSESCFEYFHDKYLGYEGMKSTAEIPLLDSRFDYTGCLFPGDSPFINGCVKVTRILKDG